MQRYDLVTWPESQSLIGNNACLLIDPESIENDEKDDAATTYDSAYMKPCADGEYVRLSWPESQAFAACKDAFADYDGNLFVPVELFGQ